MQSIPKLNIPNNIPSIPSQENQQPISFLKTLNSKINNFCSSLFIPTETPILSNAITKIGLGIVATRAVEMYRFSSLSNYISSIGIAGELASTALLVNGVWEIGYLGYSKVMSNSTSHKKTNRAKIVNKSEKDAKLHEKIKFSKLIASTGISIYCLYNYNYLGNVNWYNKTDFNIDEFLRKPKYDITDPNLQLLQIAACAIGTIVNLNQLNKYNKNDFLKTNPFSEIINTLVFAIFFSQLNAISTEAQNWSTCMENCIEDEYLSKCEHLSPPGVNPVDYATNTLREIGAWGVTQSYLMKRFIQKEIPDKFTDGLDSTYLPIKYLQEHLKNYALFIPLTNSLSLTTKNINKYKLWKPILTKQEITSITSAESRAMVREVHSPSHSKYQKKESPTVDASNNNFIDSRRPSTSSIRTPKPSPKSKTKTRGTPNKPTQSTTAKSPKSPKSTQSTTTTTTTTTTQSKNSPSTVENQTCITSDNDKTRETIRKEALARLKLLDKQNPIDTEIILKELRRAKKYLNGRIDGNGGSRYVLKWTIGNTLFCLDYETPHGNDKNTCRGNKRKRILNVLSAAYLIGLDKDKAEAYIKQYNLEKLYRIPKFIYYIFSNKTTT